MTPGEWTRALAALLVCVLAAGIILAGVASDPPAGADDWLEFATEALGGAVLIVGGFIAWGALQLAKPRGSDQR